MNLSRLLPIPDNWRNPKTGVWAITKHCPNYDKHPSKLTFASSSEAKAYRDWYNSDAGREYYRVKYPNYDYHPMVSDYYCNYCKGYHNTTTKGDWKEHNIKSRKKFEAAERNQKIKTNYQDLDDDFLKHIDEL